MPRLVPPMRKKRCEPTVFGEEAWAFSFVFCAAPRGVAADGTRTSPLELRIFVNQELAHEEQFEHALCDRRDVWVSFFVEHVGRQPLRSQRRNASNHGHRRTFSR